MLEKYLGNKAMLLDNKYEILSEVGKGGMSVVYMARNPKSNKTWAVKEINKQAQVDDEVVKQGLIAEKEILTKLHHDNLPEVVDIIDTDESMILVMDYVEGTSLDKLLNPEKLKNPPPNPQPEERVLEWAKQLCDVLVYLHSQEKPVIYRDMKPGNVMLAPKGDHVTLIDFGTAREYVAEKNRDTTSLGSRGYAAPEQYGAYARTDVRTDIYGLGATMHHLLTGYDPMERNPFDYPPVRELNGAVSDSMGKIVAKCLAYKPEDRYQDAAELRLALENGTRDEDLYRKKQKLKLASFCTTIALSVSLGITSVWAYNAGETQRSEDYDQILLTAEAAQDYYNAILTDPARVEAYFQLDEYLTEDYLITSEERGVLSQIQAGLKDNLDGGFSQTVDVLAELKAANPESYDEVCFQFGWSLLSYYDAAIDRDRYANAESWFRVMKDNGTENGNIASIFCDISQCINKIYQLRGGKVIQTEQLRSQRENLWNMLQNLLKKANGYEMDYRLQVWMEIDKIINQNAADILEVSAKSEVLELLRQIQMEADSIAASDPQVQQLVHQLNKSTAVTINKVNSAVE